MCTHSLNMMALSHAYRYVEVMTPLRYREHALIEGNDFYFRQALTSGKQGDASLCHLQHPKGGLEARCAGTNPSLQATTHVASTHGSYGLPEEKKVSCQQGALLEWKLCPQGPCLHHLPCLTPGR